jgi:hypothetical protein
MSISIRRFSCTAALFLGLLSGASWHARGCGVAEPFGYSDTFVSAERAVIIWDEANHVEHFIRQANFETRSPELGFLVPTPQTPELSEVDPRLFDLADTVGKAYEIPHVSKFTPWDPFARLLGLPSLVAGGRTPQLQDIAPPPTAVTPTGPHRNPGIIFERDVAGYHATVLSTDDYASVAAWLTQNGFAPTPQFRAWLQTYGRARWKITAFKLINGSANDGSLTTRAVRLSFPTDHPFYPYSEPSDRQSAAAASPQGRALRVAVLSNHRMAGALADGNAWAGKLVFAGKSAPNETSTIPLSPTLSVSAGDQPENAWFTYANLGNSQYKTAIPTELTTFLDESNPRPGTADLNFTPDPDTRDFKGVEVNYAMTPLRRLDLSQPLPDLAAFLFMAILCGTPVWCGSRTYFLAALKKAPAEAGEPRSPWWMIVVDRIAGPIAAFIGVVCAIPAGLGLVGGMMMLVDEFLGGLVIIAISAVALTICIATVHCGFRVLRTKASRAASSPAHPPRQRPPGLRKWDRQMAGASVMAGALLVIGVVLLFMANASA